jgi:FMN-dependent NADH-azoreductase
MGHFNHVEPHLKSVFAFLGVTEAHSIAVEYDEFADERLARSLAEADGAVEQLVRELTGRVDEEATRAA